MPTSRTLMHSAVDDLRQQLSSSTDPGYGSAISSPKRSVHVINWSAPRPRPGRRPATVRRDVE